MELRAISALEAIRTRLEEDLGLTEPIRELVRFSEALDLDEGLSVKDLKRGVKIISKDNPEWGSFQVLGPAKGVPGTWEIRGRRGERVLDKGELRFWKLAEGVSWNGHTLEAKGAEKVACAVSGALGLKKGQKGDKKKLAKEIAKRTGSKKVARKALKLAQEF